MAAGRWASDNTIRNLAVVLTMSPFGTAAAARAQGDPRDREWMAVAALARHFQAEAYRAGTHWRLPLLPDPLCMGPPSPADVADGVAAIEALCILPRYRLRDVGAAWVVSIAHPAWFAARFLQEVGAYRPRPLHAPAEHVEDPAELEG